MGFDNIIVETKDGVGLVTLNRPQALNALNSALLGELAQALAVFEADRAIRCIVIAGNDKAFAAGADVKEMQDKDFVESYLGGFLEGQDALADIRKPAIAAVVGFCLGGGLELAMMCDIVIAADTAKLGQPEITLGIMPGMGGTQRLARFVGKAKAMDLILTGRLMDAEEAERCGLISRVVPADKLMEETMAAARRIASHSLPIALMAKETVNRAYETSLAEGLRFERRLFLSMLATEDQKEGMRAFVEKRKPSFRDR